MIESLIDKQDSFEIIRDQIAGILVSESSSQQALASAAGKDPDEWTIHVYTERSNPWENWLNAMTEPDDETDTSPIVCVWFDNASFDKGSSNIMERQKAEAVINIDCYGLGLSADDPTGGHFAGDREANFEAQRAYRLVRNILMAANYTYLDLRGLVWSRWPQSATAFQPTLDGRTIQHVQAVRLALRVEFNEFAPQISGDTLEFVAIDVKRSADGLIYLEADYDYTL